MPRSQCPADEPASQPAGLLSLEDLETGLRLLDRGDKRQTAFWDENVEAFRRTVLFAIRETSDALLSPMISEHWRVLLQRQLESLVSYIELADRYIDRRRTASDRTTPLPNRRRPAGSHGRQVSILGHRLV
jgi:hypothetical protein